MRAPHAESAAPRECGAPILVRMDSKSTATDILTALGGSANVTANGTCMTRLRVVVRDAADVDRTALAEAEGVLGIVLRGERGLEIVFGPGAVEGVARGLSKLTGLPVTETTFGDAPHVLVSAAARSAGEPSKKAEALAATLGEGADGLAQILDDEPSEEVAEDAGRRVLVINGPNINMLGIREPDLYGTEDFAALLALCQEAAAEAGFSSCTCVQSNHEGDLVDAIQEAYGAYDGIVMNPGAYTHTSIALLDALKAVSVPCVEVHISKVDAREKFRQVSYVRQACFETVTGMGIEGYRKAIRDLAEHLGMSGT